MIWQGYVGALGYIALILTMAGVLKRFTSISEENTRKFVHILLAFAWPILYFWLAGTIHFILVPLLFVFVTLYDYKHDLLRMISRSGKKEPGAILYTVSITIMASISVLRPSTDRKSVV